MASKDGDFSIDKALKKRSRLLVIHSLKVGNRNTDTAASSMPPSSTFSGYVLASCSPTYQPNHTLNRASPTASLTPSTIISKTLSTSSTPPASKQLTLSPALSHTPTIPTSPSAASATGYPATFILGLVLYGIGAFLMWPAALKQSFGGFCGTTSTIGTGLGTLETAANPYVAGLFPITVSFRHLANSSHLYSYRPPWYAELRINITQAIQAVGTIVAPSSVPTSSFGTQLTASLP